MNHSEAGKLGALKVLEQIVTKKIERVNRYNKNPLKCLYCGNPLGYKDKIKRKRFCSHSCSASYNNKGVRRHGVNPEKKCIGCGCLTKNPKYCCLECQQKHKWDERKKEIILSGIEKAPRCAKKFLIETKGAFCSVCGETEWMKQPVPLVLDHINGNYQDARIENMRLVCGNCDMQLPTYKNKNYGNGRAFRRKRYADGKSY